MNVSDHENEYRAIVCRFIAREVNVESFITQYFTLWKRHVEMEWAFIDGGGKLLDNPLRGVLDRIFTAADCYRRIPENWWEISEEQLRAEIFELAKERQWIQS
jgi:hypothetical protein